MTTRRKLRRYLVLTVGLLVAAAIAAPFLSANHFGQRIRTALESELGRKVEIGEAHFMLLPGPGFVLSQVVIHEDPAFGVEPISTMASLEGRLRLWPLVRGRMDFAALKLQEPSMNLVKAEESGGTGRWNFEALLGRTSLSSLPEIHVRNGRINFKFGDTKSVFYGMNADLDIFPPGPGGTDWRVEFAGEPARTDRPARGFGRLGVKGVYRQPSTAKGNLDLRVVLEPTALADITSLVAGYDAGIQGFVSTRARFQGPLDAVQAAGKVDLEDLRNWGILSRYGQRFSLEYRGVLDVSGQYFQIESPADKSATPAIRVRCRVSDYLAKPKWGMSVHWEGLPVEPALTLARQMGTPLPPDLVLTGTTDGAIGYSGQGPWQGGAVVSGATVSIAKSPALHAERVELLLDGPTLRLRPALVTASPEDRATVEAKYHRETGDFELGISTDSLSLEALRAQVALAGVPALHRMSSGISKGKLRYRVRPGSAGEWAGQASLQNAELAIEGFQEPLRMGEMKTSLQGDRVVAELVDGSMGMVRFRGAYRYEPKLLRPHRFHLSFSELDAAELERLMSPTIDRRQGLIARALALGRAPVPPWLLERRADGTVEIDSLLVGGAKLNHVRTRVVWDRTSISAGDFEAHFGNAVGRGRLQLDLSGGSPGYRLGFQLDGLEWRNGKWGGDFAIQSHGIGKDLLENLRSDGSFAAVNVALSEGATCSTLSGVYELVWSKNGPKLKLTELEASMDGQLFLGEGQSREDGQLLIRLGREGEERLFTGTVDRIEAVP